MIAFTDEYDTWIAKDLKDLKTLICEEEKILSAQDFDEVDWQDLHDDTELTIILYPYENGPKEIRTIKSWIEKNGRGFLCSTEY